MKHAAAPCGVGCLAEKPVSVALCCDAERSLVVAHVAGEPRPAPESRYPAPRGAVELDKAGLVRDVNFRAGIGLKRGPAYGVYAVCALKVASSGTSTRASFGWRTVSTGHGAVRTTRSATLPNTACEIPRRPCVPITIRST
jgi:hypothetical protein